MDHTADPPPAATTPAPAAPPAATYRLRTVAVWPPDGRRVPCRRVRGHLEWLGGTVGAGVRVILSWRVEAAPGAPEAEVRETRERAKDAAYREKEWLEDRGYEYVVVEEDC